MSDISISGLGAVSGSESTTKKKTTDTVEEAFSSILNQMKSTMSMGGSSGSSDSDSNDETTTITRVMSDGTVVINVYKGDELISQTKMKPDTNEEQDQLVSSVTSNQTAPATAGLSASELMALTQN